MAVQFACDCCGNLIVPTKQRESIKGEVTPCANAGIHGRHNFVDPETGLKITIMVETPGDGNLNPKGDVHLKCLSKVIDRNLGYQPILRLPPSGDNAVEEGK